MGLIERLEQYRDMLYEQANSADNLMLPHIADMLNHHATGVNAAIRIIKEEFNDCC